MIKIEKAKKDNFKMVQSFYFNLIDNMKNSKYFPSWEKEIYPTNQYLLESIIKGNLYIGIDENNIISAMVINNEYNEEYKKAKWSKNLLKDNINVIHILGVNPEISNKGIGKKMVDFVINLTKQQEKKSIRLDVLEGNLPAEKLYLKCGFKYVDTLPMFYEDTGWTNFKLYEYNISN